MLAEERKMNRMLVKDFLQFDNDKEEKIRKKSLFLLSTFAAKSFMSRDISLILPFHAAVYVRRRKKEEAKEISRLLSLSPFYHHSYLISDDTRNERERSGGSS